MSRMLSYDKYENIISSGSDSQSNRQEIWLAGKALKGFMESELTERQRQCVRLYYFERVKQEEVAERLGISKSVVSRHLKKARERLLRAMRYSSCLKNRQT